MAADDDVLIIGGGPVGVCAAYYLAEAGCHVTLLERDELCSRYGGAYANAGLIVPSEVYPLAAPGALGQGLKWLLDSGSPFFIQPRLDPALWRWLLLFRRACAEERMRPLMPVLRALGRRSADLFAELAVARGKSFGYEQKGWLNLYATENGLAAGVAEAAEARALGVAAEVVDAQRAREMMPGLAGGVAGGVFHAENAHVDPQVFVSELGRRAARKGADIRLATEVIGLRTVGRRIVRVMTTRGDLEAGTVVLAAGCWSPALARLTGLNLPIQPAKGYSVTVARPEGFPELPAYLAEGHVCITPLGDRLRMAGTLELAGMDMRVRANRVAGIRRGAARFLPGLADREALEIWRGPRPVTPDGLPIVGRSPRHENLIVAAGHCMLGLSLGPVTGKLVAQLVAGQTPDLDLEPVRVDRFGLA